MTRFDPDRAAFQTPTPVNTYFFYDLETSGLSPREDRIMQFAGQRTDMNFNPIGDPVNLLVKLNDDTLPSPGAIMVTKITPQSTQLDGLTEAEFCDYVMSEIFTPGTIEVGYNSLRFDDEFMRHIFWRNFRDPYEWQWKEGRSKWDLLDVVRLTRALRPEGIVWPSIEIPDSDAKSTSVSATSLDSKNGSTASSSDAVPGPKDGPAARPAKLIATNKLELLTKMNGIEHKHAHDALSDVEALISVTKLIHDKQPQLFSYLFKMRDKNELKKLINLENPKPFVYATGRYSGEFNKTSVAFPIAPGRNGNPLVFDLRFNLEELLKQEQDFKPEQRTSRSGEKYQTRWSWIPYVKELAYNRCPAVAPLGVLEAASTDDSTDPVFPFKKGATGWQKIGLEKSTITKNLKTLQQHPEFIKRMQEFFAHRSDDFGTFVETIGETATSSETTGAKILPHDPESALYDSFVSEIDRRKCVEICARGRELAGFDPKFSDKRLPDLFLHYKARNYKNSLTDAENVKWQEYRKARLMRQEKTFVAELERLQNDPDADRGILEDLVLWYQSLGESDYA